MSEEKDLYLDVDFETARALHRVVRAMHDGECPNCHVILNAPVMRRLGGWQCPDCKFTITDEEANDAIKAFAPVMERNLKVFEKWRASRTPCQKEKDGSL